MLPFSGCRNKSRSYCIAAFARRPLWRATGADKPGPRDRWCIWGGWGIGEKRSAAGPTIWPGRRRDGGRRHGTAPGCGGGDTRTAPRCAADTDGGGATRGPGRRRLDEERPHANGAPFGAPPPCHVRSELPSVHLLCRAVRELACLGTPPAAGRAWVHRIVAVTGRFSPSPLSTSDRPACEPPGRDRFVMSMDFPVHML